MADGKKRRNPGKPLPPTAMGNPMKQKTLFDSFPLKNPAKITTRQPSESRDLTHSGTAVKSAGHIRNASSLSDIIDLTKARTKSPSPFIEVIEDSKCSSTFRSSLSITQANREDLVETARERKENTNGACIVPSVIVVDDNDAIVSAATGSLQLSHTSQSLVPCEGKSADQPIIIPASPLKALYTSIRPPERADKPARPFFLSKPRTSTQSFPSKTSSPKHVAKVAPYPDRSSQHVKGFQTFLQTPSTSIFPFREQRTFVQSPKDSTSYAFLKQRDTRHYLPAALPSPFPMVQSRPPEFNHVPDEHELNHPALTRFMNKTPENLQSRRPWSEKWQPSCAQEVLGNEKSAIYLRDWLRALELQLEDGRTTNPPKSKDDVPKGTAKAPSRGIKRPRVVRAVEKTRGRKKLRHNSDDEDDWIVYTDEELDDDVLTHSEVDIYGDLIPEPPASLECSQNSDIQPLMVDNVGPNLGQLHNTILLTGPHGNGKTAAVYACAEELDWDVFEVYPGIGKRNGANLDNYIGEVGKNHLVHRTDRNSGDFLRSLFRQREDIDAANISPSCDRADTEIQGQSTKPAKSIRQSLILLEEVDILFKEDNNFWNTVTGIIKECKRPVVCTCNDISLVPVQDLPLQTVLEFKPCPGDVAVSYLQNLCSAEGYFVESDILLQLYTRSALSSEALQSAPDLRRTIHALQVICLPAKEAMCNEMPTAAAKTNLSSIEFLSYMDSYLVEDPSQAFVTEELASYVPSNDDEIGHCILYDPDAKDTCEAGRQEEISLFARQVSRVDVTREEYRKRDCELRRMVEEVCPVWVWSRQDGSVYMDYVPLIRQLVEADDAQEEADMKGRGGRTTRNSTRAHGYVRTVVLTAQGRYGLICNFYLTMATRDSSAKQSPVASLASLEYLQNQRRGSITDPSRHVVKLNTNYRDHSSGSSSIHQESPTSRSHMSDPRPSSPYVFGDATTSQQEHSSQLRKLLHSPSSEHVSHRPTSHDSHQSSRNYTGSDHMNIDHDNDRHPFPNRRNIREPNFDFTMRRHSIAVGQNSITLPHISSTLHGTKRKMSGDRGVFSPVGEDLDPQLAGPGVPSTMDIDAEAPAQKRRGSAIDTQRIAQLSLNDRRNSVDSRGAQWLPNDRRDSAPSLFHTVPGISSFGSNFDSSNTQQNRAPSSMATFSWPASSQPDAINHSTIQNDSTDAPRQFEPLSQLNMVPPLNYNVDRRMSVPDNLINPLPPRPLPSRSRPPSRQNTDPQSGPSSGQEEPSSASSPNASGKAGKEGGITPYSRSPELRVSHKLAERKRRKEMKDLFDELRDQLPADRGMKASKWEILSKAIEFVIQLKRSHQEMAQELQILRQQVNGSRQENISGYPSSPLGHTSYCPPVVGPYPPSIMHPHQPSNHSGHSDSRSNSTQDMFPPTSNASLQNGHPSSRIEGPPT